MLRRAGSLAALALLAGLLALGASCSARNDAGGAANATSTAPASATGVQDIRQEDLTQQPDLQQFIQDSGGFVEKARIMYADLTGDGVDEAVVPVESGGEGGDIAVFVYAYTSGGLGVLLKGLPEDQRLTAAVTAGALTISDPVFADGDPLCCPSQLKVKTYGWDGSKLSIESEALQQQSSPKGGAQ
jgi:hypothetical protein